MGFEGVLVVDVAAGPAAGLGAGVVLGFFFQLFFFGSCENFIQIKSQSQVNSTFVTMTTRKSFSWIWQSWMVLSSPRILPERKSYYSSFFERNTKVEVGRHLPEWMSFWCEGSKPWAACMSVLR